MSILIDIRDDTAAPWQAAFASVMPGEDVIWARDTGDRDLSQVDWALVWAADPAVLRRATGLKAVFSMGAGVDHVFRSEFVPDVPVIRFVDPDLTTRMSEWVVLQCLMHLRQQRAYDALQRRKIWRQLPQPVAADVVVGIMGLGVLGLDAAAKLKALGFTVQGWSRTRKTVEGLATYAADELDAFLAGTDILVSLLPHTPDTSRLVDRALLEKLRKDGPLGGPVFVNAGRGRTHAEADLVAALRDGLLKGASLDVFEREPLAKESPLWEMENVIVTPHVAAWSDIRAVARHVAAQIARHRAGLPFEHVADRSRGY